MWHIIILSDKHFMYVRQMHSILFICNNIKEENVWYKCLYALNVVHATKGSITHCQRIKNTTKCKTISWHKYSLVSLSHKHKTDNKAIYMYDASICTVPVIGLYVERKIRFHPGTSYSFHSSILLLPLYPSHMSNSASASSEIAALGNPLFPYAQCSCVFNNK